MQVSLLELQQAFRHAIASGDAGSIIPWVAADGGDDVAERVGIYRNNSRTNLSNALRADFPVVEKLVGAEFFAHVAAAFVTATPSRSGDVGAYGKSFPDFLAAFPAASSLPYLADVARLERAWADVFLAAEPTVDLSALCTVAEERLGDIRFSFNPAARLLASRYPILTIWHVNQAGYDGDMHVSLDMDRDSGASEASGEAILLLRRDIAVEMHRLEPGEHAWLLALHSGNTLSEAVDAALVRQQDFDLSSSLPQHLGLGTFVSFFVSPVLNLAEENSHEK